MLSVYHRCLVFYDVCEIKLESGRKSTVHLPIVLLLLHIRRYYDEIDYSFSLLLIPYISFCCWLLWKNILGPLRSHSLLSLHLLDCDFSESTESKASFTLVYDTTDLQLLHVLSTVSWPSKTPHSANSCRPLSLTLSSPSLAPFFSPCLKHQGSPGFHSSSEWLVFY